MSECQTHGNLYHIVGPYSHPIARFGHVGFHRRAEYNNFHILKLSLTQYRPQHEALGNKPEITTVVIPQSLILESIHCFRLNFNIPKLVYFYATGSRIFL